MAMLIHLAMIITVAMVTHMEPHSAPFIKAEFRAERFVNELLSAHGWRVQRAPDIGPYEADFIARKGGQAFVVEVKAFSEGRPDRVIPLLSHAILEAQAYARAQGQVRPLAIVHVGHASPSLLKHIEVFAHSYANDVAVGIVSDNGLRHFIGGALEALNAEAEWGRSGPARSAGRSPRLFSDLNQWMLKVLLAPEIPEHLLAAPRGEYRNVSELAKAAHVSVMSAFRFVQLLRDEGFLDDESRHLRVVRRPELFRRWQADALRAAPNEIPMQFLLRGRIDEQILRQASEGRASLALFSAAEALKMGHVSGVPPYLYVRKLSPLSAKEWPALPAPAGARPDFVLREAPAPESVFRGAVHVGEVSVCDVLQVWLDVSAHSSRGQEQADFILRKVLSSVIEGASR